MLLSTAALVIGVTVEKNQGHSESSVEQAHSGAASEGQEHAEGEEAEGAESHSEESETIGGIDVESTPIIVIGAVLSLAVAGAALRWSRREVFAALALALHLGATAVAAFAPVRSTGDRAAPAAA